MPIKLSEWRAVLTPLGLVLAVQPAAALYRVHNHHQADGVVRSRDRAPRPQAHYSDTPNYDDPSKFGGSTSPSAMAASPSAPPSTETLVHVQPRSNTFTPNSNEEKAVQKQITDFDQMQRLQDKPFDRKLLICRGC
jgi:hypothetical protein